jgi:hypothetical protein
MKAYFVHPDDERTGYVVHAETLAKAKWEVCKQVSSTWEWEYKYLRGERMKGLDDKAITIESLIEDGFNMTFEGEPIEELDVQCQCEICKRIDRE